MHGGPVANFSSLFHICIYVHSFKPPKVMIIDSHLVFHTFKIHLMELFHWSYQKAMRLSRKLKLLFSLKVT